MSTGVKLRIIIGVVLVTWLSLAAAAWLYRYELPPRVDALLNGPATSPGVPVDAADRALHDSLRIVDLHADPLLWNRAVEIRAGHGHVDLPRLQAGNVALQVFGVPTHVPLLLNPWFNLPWPDSTSMLATLYRWPEAAHTSPRARALHAAKLLHGAELRSAGALRIIRTRGDLLALEQARAGVGTGTPRPVGALLGTEGAFPLEGRAENLQVLFDAGFRMLGLAHFLDSELAGSAHAMRGGLTPLGQLVIRRAEDMGVLLDLAHASPATIADVAAVARRPLIVSHTGVQATCPGPRNLSDDQVRAVAHTGGVIGIGLFPLAVCGSTVEAVVAAMMHVKRLVGAQHVALGSDWDGAVSVVLDPSQLVQLTAGLRGAGATGDEIRTMMGVSALQLLHTNLPD